MSLWIELSDKLQPLADMVGAHAQIVASVSSSDGATPQQKQLVVADAVRVSEMSRKQLEQWGIGEA